MFCVLESVKWDALETEESVETQIILNVAACCLLLCGHELWILKCAHETVIWNMAASHCHHALPLTANPRQWHYACCKHSPSADSAFVSPWLAARMNVDNADHLVFTGHTLLPHALRGHWATRVVCWHQPFCFGHQGFKWVRGNKWSQPAQHREVYKSRGSLIIETEFNFISGCVSLWGSVWAGTLLVAAQTCADKE